MQYSFFLSFFFFAKFENPSYSASSVYTFCILISASVSLSSHSLGNGTNNISPETPQGHRGEQMG